MTAPETKKKELKKIIEKSKKENSTILIIDWYLKNKKEMGFSSGFDALNWYNKR